MPGRGTVDAVFVLRRFTEKLKAKNKLFFVFFGLEKAFEWVPREVIYFALRRGGDCPRVFGKWGCLLIKVVKLLS